MCKLIKFSLALIILIAPFIARADKPHHWHYFGVAGQSQVYLDTNNIRKFYDKVNHTLNVDVPVQFRGLNNSTLLMGMDCTNRTLAFQNVPQVENLDQITDRDDIGWKAYRTLCVHKK